MSATAHEPDDAAAIIDAAFAGIPFQSDPEHQQRPFFTAAGIARYFQVPESFVFDLIDSGSLPAHVYGGFECVWADDVEAFIEAASAYQIEAPPPRMHRRDQWPEPERTYAVILLADPCCYCGAPANSIDHIEPTVRGGAHSWENFTAACQRCNSRKGARPMLAFLLKVRTA